jgi:hypothetical protein
MIIETKNCKFYLDATDSELGRIHEQLIELLKDSAKLERFKELLEEDNNSAYSIFVSENNVQ